MNSSNYTARLLSIAEQDLRTSSPSSPPRTFSHGPLADRIERDLQNLGRHPHLGRIPNDERLAALSYRVLVIENDLVFYKMRRKIVLTHRILHGLVYIPSPLEDM